MAKILSLLLLIQLAVSPIYTQGQTADTPVNTPHCEQVTHVALEKLLVIFQKNNFEQLESVLNTIQSSCGENEFTQRLRILRALIEKKATGDLVADYLAKNYQDILIMRWDYSIEEKHRQIYLENKADFDFVPLKHPIDSLTKIKALALLNSPSYSLTEQEENITLLFADLIEEFQQAHHPTPTKKQSDKSASGTGSSARYRSGVNVYAGAEFPLTGTDPIFKTSPTLGVSFSSRLSRPVLFEIGAKVRINTNDKEFEYELNNEIEIVRSTASLSLGGAVGYKIFDNDKIIIAPKAGLFLEMATTGLSEVRETYYDDGYDYYESEYLRYYHVNTMRATLGISAMRRLSDKTYIGLETAYHFIPYNWDGSLLTSIQPNYGSLQLFLRF